MDSEGLLAAIRRLKDAIIHFLTARRVTGQTFVLHEPLIVDATRHGWIIRKCVFELAPDFQGDHVITVLEQSRRGVRKTDFVGCEFNGNGHKITCLIMGQFV